MNPGRGPFSVPLNQSPDPGWPLDFSAETQQVLTPGCEALLPTCSGSCFALERFLRAPELTRQQEDALLGLLFLEPGLTWVLATGTLQIKRK